VFNQARGVIDVSGRWSVLRPFAKGLAWTMFVADGTFLRAEDILKAVPELRKDVFEERDLSVLDANRETA
jgi:hypothetical protein